MANLYYFNNAATSWPKPQSVIDSVKSFFNVPPINSARHCNCIKKPTDVDVECKRKIALFFNVDTEKYDVVITAGATYSANIVINWLKVRHYNTLLVDNGAHNAIYRTHYEKIGNRPLIEHFKLWNEDFTQNEEYKEFKQCLKGTDVYKPYAAISHVNNVDGTLVTEESLQRIFNEFRQFDIPIIIDITQSAGTYDIDIKKWNYDNLYVICSGHKGLYSATGIGFLIAPKNKIDIPFVSGGTGGLTGMDYRHTDTLEAGTPNELAMVSLIGGLNYINSKQMSNIRMSKKILVNEFLNRYSEFKNPDFDNLFEIVPVHNPESGIISFKNKDKQKCEEFITIMSENYNIMVRNGVHCAPLYHMNILNCDATMRISFSPFNTKMEIIYIFDCFNRILKRFKMHGFI